MLQFTFAGCEVQHIASSETMLTITACALTKTGACPSCGEETSHVHSYYQRHPQDLPISGLQVQLILRVRRFRCLNVQCARHTFALSLAGIAGLSPANQPFRNHSGKHCRRAERASWFTAG